MDERKLVIGADWTATFPQIITPYAEEWLPGFLLRCDRANGWLAGTSAGYCARDVPPKTPGQFILGTHIDQDVLASALALPSAAAITVTTFSAELAELYDLPVSALSVGLFGLVPPIRVCPVCLREGLGVRKHLAWPQITCCPVHDIPLHTHCVCGAPLRFFLPAHSLRSSEPVSFGEPFTCFRCGHAWRLLPDHLGDERTITESRLRAAYYQLLLAERSVELFVKAHFLLASLSLAWNPRHILYGLLPRKRSERWYLRHPQKPPETVYTVGKLVDIMARYRIPPRAVLATKVDKGFLAAYARLKEAKEVNEAKRASRPSAETRPRFADSARLDHNQLADGGDWRRLALGSWSEPGGVD